MKYIKKVILENFQSHKHTEIDLNEKLNIVVGPSDSGKTAILRAIKWVLYNEPSGDFFIREGESEASVTLIFSDNTKLTRYRSKSKNVYDLTYNNGSQLRLEGFGLGVPHEIKEAVGIYKINLDGNETRSVSLAEQLEGPFLLSEKNSTRASAIGQLVGVDVIDEALRDVLKDLKSFNTTRKNYELEIEHLSQEIKTYDYLDDLEKTTNKLSDIRDSINRHKKTLDKLNNNKERFNNLLKEISRLEIINKNLSRVEDVEGILSSLEKLHMKYWQLNKYNENLQKLKRHMNENEIILDKLKDLESTKEIEVNLVNLSSRYNRLLDSNKKYRSITRESINLENKLELILIFIKEEDNIKEIEKKYKSLQKFSGLKDRYEKVRTSIYMGNKYIKQFDGVNHVLDKSKKLEKNMDLLSKLNKEYDRLSTIYKEKDRNMKSLNEIRIDGNNLSEKYKSILKKIEKCPLCFSEINNDKIEHIMDHFIGG